MQDTLPAATPTILPSPNTIQTTHTAGEGATPDYNYVTQNGHTDTTIPHHNNKEVNEQLKLSTEIQTNDIQVQMYNPGEITKGEPLLVVLPPNPSLTPMPPETVLPLDTPTTYIEHINNTPIPPDTSLPPTAIPDPTPIPLEITPQAENQNHTLAPNPTLSHSENGSNPTPVPINPTPVPFNPAISQPENVHINPAPTQSEWISSTPIVQPITPIIAVSEIRSSISVESDKPERQPYVPGAASSSVKTNRRFSTFIEPPMPVEHKKDRLRHHVKLAHKKNTLGETIYKGHPSWLLMRDIQTGLYTNIKNMAQRTQEIGLFVTPPVTILPIASPSAKFTFKFKDYCPMAFYNLREHFGINHVDYVTSLCQNWNEVGTPGKSGSLFFFSLDNQYVLKTIPKREAKILRELLPAYYHHMTTNTNSLLTRFMGLHRVKPHKGRQVRFLVMGNLFNSNLRVHMRFDLKGSTVGRELTAAERTKKNPTYKDLDFRRLNRKLHLGPNREAMLKQLQADTDFLNSQDIMDYSLLVGIHFLQEKQDETGSDDEADVEDFDVPPRTPPLNRSAVELPPYVSDTEIRPPNQALSIFEREEGGIRARQPDGAPLEEFYYMGVIDILMHYSLRKQIEHAAKRIIHPRGQISSVEPHLFATRFMKFVVDIID